MVMPKIISPYAVAIAGLIFDKFANEIDLKISALSAASFQNNKAPIMDAKIKAYVKSKQTLNRIIAEVTGIETEVCP